MRILFLSRWYPFPPDNGSKIRVYNLLRGLSERHAVTLISFINSGAELAGVSLPDLALDDVKVCEYREFRPNSRQALLGYLSRTPRYLIDTYQPAMAALIRETCRNSPHDLVIASQTSMAAYQYSFSGVPAIFDEVELGLFRPNGGDDLNRCCAVRQRFTWEKHRRYIARIVEKFRACTVVSERERDLVVEIAPGYRPVHVIPNCIDVDAHDGAATKRVPGALVFTGPLSYQPNHFAMGWFLNDIYPSIQVEVSGVTLTITGDPGSQPVLTAPGVTYAGVVPDIRQVIGSSSVSVVPLRSGGGTRLKILESLALRTPVVTTSKGAEGLDVRTGEHLLIADTPGEFARSVVKLLRDPEHARALAEKGFKLVRERYNSDVVLPKFLQLVDEVAHPS
ncbi:MAG: glycosyltransferase family 4 protein [Acidobacteriales bacterium]|nr:glycosyltransferase family 4 protein [Terriglobales bacterium]